MSSFRLLSSLRYRFAWGTHPPRRRGTYRCGVSEP